MRWDRLLGATALFVLGCTGADVTNSGTLKCWSGGQLVVDERVTNYVSYDVDVAVATEDGHEIRTYGLCVLIRDKAKP